RAAPPAHTLSLHDALPIFRELYEAGAVPRNLVGMKAEDANTWMQTGRAAMTMSSMSRNGLYNDPEKSQVAGKIKTTTFPVAEARSEEHTSELQSRENLVCR